MIVLTFNVTGTDLRRTDLNRIVAVSRNNVSAKFSFNSDWDDISPRVVQFYKGEKYYDVSLVNDECTVPWEVLTEAGTLSVTVTGGDLITTTTVDINVYGTGLSSSGLAPTVASPGVYSEVVKLASEINADYTNMKSIMDTYEDTVNNSMTDISEAAANVHESEINAAEYASEAEKSAESAAGSLEDLKNTVINIHNSVEGNVVSVADASDKKIDEINVYGKSSQASTPTMTAPVDIEDPFDSLTASVYAANKNLLSTQYTKDNPLTLTADKDKYTYYPPVSYKAVVIKGVTYTFSYETDGVAGTEGDTTDTVHAAAFDADNHIWYTTRNKNYVTFVAKETGLLSFRVGINMNGCTHSFWNFQVEMGDVKTDYAAGERQSIDITLTEPLRGIAVDAGGNYTDNTGQQYFADVICEQNGEIGVLRNVEKVRVTGEITQVASYPNRGLVVYKTPANYSNYSNSIKAGICTHFNYSSALSEGSINRTVDNKINIVTADTYTVDEINTFFNDNEVYIYLCLSNPVFEPFEEEIQNQFKALTAYYGITNVCNSEGAHTRLNYTADTKLYIDNKFNELAKAITATESEV